MTRNKIICKKKETQPLSWLSRVMELQNFREVRKRGTLKNKTVGASIAEKDLARLNIPSHNE